MNLWLSAWMFLLLTFSSASASFLAQATEQIDINTAPAEQLMRLPGIGAGLAARIVEHRQKYGPFKRPQEIIAVRGMSAKLYRRIASLIRI